MAWTPPDDAEVWTPPEDAILADSVEMAPPAQAQPKQNMTWWESAFPRASKAVIERQGSPELGAGLDLLSLPGRAVSTAIRGPVEGETWQEAFARQGGGSPDNVVTRGVETVLRDPATPALAAVTAMTGGASAPAWLTRAGLAGRVAPAAATLTGLQQAQRGAEGRKFSGGELAKDVAINTALGLIPETATVVGKGAKKLGATWLNTVIKPTDKAKSAGWNAYQVLDELSKEGGWLPTTLTGLREKFIKSVQNRAAARPAAIAADEAAAQAAGIPARVNFGEASDAAQNALLEEMINRKLTGATGAAPSAANWVSRELQTEYGPSYGTIEEALRARQGLDKFAFVPNAKGASAAREIAAKAGRANINQQLDVIAPKTRAIDATLAPLMANAEGMGVVGSRRLNNALLNPTDAILGLIAAEGAKGGSSTVGTGLGAALASRVLRTPAPATALWQTGRGLGLLGQVPSAFPLAFRGSN